MQGSFYSSVPDQLDHQSSRLYADYDRRVVAESSLCQLVTVQVQTKAGVSEGTLIVRDKDKQQQDVAQLNRDTEHANDGSISPIFNKEKEQNRLKQAQLIGEIGGQAMDVIRTQGDIAGLKAQKDPAALAQAREQLEKSGKPTNDAAVMQQAYDNAMRQYGTGATCRRRRRR